MVNRPNHRGERMIDQSWYQHVLQQLGVEDFGADLAGGKIHWTNAGGEVVAHATFKAILSWAATNNSIMWAQELEQFREAGVPVLGLDPGSLGLSRSGAMGDNEAANLAREAASAADALFVYRAPNGDNALYLAVYDFETGNIELGPEELERRETSAQEYISTSLGNIANVLEDESRREEVRRLLVNFKKALEQQAELLSGSPAADDVRGLIPTVRRWLPLLDEDTAGLKKRLTDTAFHWRNMNA